MVVIECPKSFVDCKTCACNEIINILQVYFSLVTSDCVRTRSCVVFLANTSLRSRVIRRVLTRSRTLSQPKNVTQNLVGYKNAQYNVIHLHAHIYRFRKVGIREIQGIKKAGHTTCFFGAAGRICKERSDGIAFCSTIPICFWQNASPIRLLDVEKKRRNSDCSALPQSRHRYGIATEGF